LYCLSFCLSIQWSKEEGQTIQWSKEEEQTTQGSKEDGQTIQWSKEEGQTIQWSKEEGQITIYKTLHRKLTKQDIKNQNQLMTWLIVVEYLCHR
jgi:hypothetical protein